MCNCKIECAKQNWKGIDHTEVHPEVGRAGDRCIEARLGKSRCYSRLGEGSLERAPHSLQYLSNQLGHSLYRLVGYLSSKMPEVTY